MKIKILKKNEITFGEWQDGQIRLGCTPDECKSVMQRDVLHFLRQGKPCCILDSVEPDEPFFCTIGAMFGPDILNQFNAVARIEHKDDRCFLKVDRYLNQKLRYHDNGDKFVVGAYHPKDISYLPNLGCSVMTSDGLICLEEDQYIGVKDGEIVELSATELLEQLSKHRAARSPRYGAVEVTPTRVRPSRPRNGTIIFNDITGKLEVFTKNEWKGLKLED